MRFLFKLLSRLSLDALYRIVGRPFFDWGYYILRWRRKLAADNIARSFPELSAEARATILKESYRNLSDIVSEIIWSYGASPAELRKRVDVLNPEVVLERIRAGQSILLMTAHYCNWEWQVLAGNTWLDEPMFPVYKPQRVAAIDNFLREARGRFGGTPIPHTKLTRELLRRRSEANVYAMVADQTPVHNEAKYWTTFLHQDTAFFMGADAIARILQAAVVFVEMQRVRRGHYTMKVSVIAEPPYDRGASNIVVERYVRALESEIRGNPANWLWIHRKWKYPKPPDA